jgi:hypothetical protein
LGITPPVKMRTASPAPMLPSNGRPANDSPMRFSGVGASASSRRSAPAQPSIAELSWPGTSIGETTSAASTRPSAWRMCIFSTVVIGAR